MFFTSTSFSRTSSFSLTFSQAVCSLKRGVQLLLDASYTKDEQGHLLYELQKFAELFVILKQKRAPENRVFWNQANILKDQAYMYFIDWRRTSDPALWNNITKR